MPQGLLRRQGSSHESLEQRVGLIGTALEFRVILHTHIEGPVGQLHRFHQPSIGGQARQGQAGGRQRLPIFVVELVAVAVTLGNLSHAVAALHGRARADEARIAAQAQRAALIHRITLAGHVIDNLVQPLRSKLAGVGICDAQHMAGIFDHCHLHAQADAEIGDVLFPGILGCQDHPLNAAAAEAAGHQDAIQTGESGFHRFCRDQLGIDPADADLGIQEKARVAQRLRH